MERSPDLIVSREQEGQRLDVVLGGLLPEEGLRSRRRLCASGAVLVNERARPKGFRLRVGDRVSLLSLQEEESAQPDRSLLNQTRIVQQNRAYAALFKPAGLHTESVSRSPEPAAEEVLSCLFPQNPARLMNRLDKYTSGILLVALGSAAGEEYKRFQDSGRVCKDYLAFVHGRVEAGQAIRTMIDAAGGRRVRILNRDEPDPKRWSLVRPLGFFADEGGSLLLVRILKGKRHQIRAHLACIGHPVAGDPLYGHGQRPSLSLHHCRISFPDFTAQVWPDWINQALSEQGFNHEVIRGSDEYFHKMLCDPCGISTGRG